MGIFNGLKARKAVFLHQKGQTSEAITLYEQLYADQYLSSAYMVPYCILLIRKNEKESFEKVKEILKKAEKAPDLTPDRRKQLILYYAVAQYKLGEIDKAIRLLEASHQKSPNGVTYGALGFMYIQAGDAEKALQYNQEALEYDDEDPVTLDNLGQTYYRLLNDKETAKKYFDQAIAIKENQIDTLYFLSRYDLEAGDKIAAVEKLEKAAEGNFSPLNYITREDVEREIKALKA